MDCSAGGRWERSKAENRAAMAGMGANGMAMPDAQPTTAGVTVYAMPCDMKIWVGGGRWVPMARTMPISTFRSAASMTKMRKISRIPAAIGRAFVSSEALPAVAQPGSAGPTPAGFTGVLHAQGRIPTPDARPPLVAASEQAVQRELDRRRDQQRIDEARAVLAEGIVADADLIDAGLIFGTGFAPFRGGPLHYLESKREQR